MARFTVAAAALLLLSVAFARPAGAQESEAGLPPVVVGSKFDVENRLLGEILAQLIEAHTPIPVERRLGLGGTAVVFSAIQSGEVDIYPEYTGTGWAVQLGLSEPVREPLRAYLRVAREFRQRWNLAWLQPFGFENSYELAMRGPAAERMGIRSISDLVEHQDEIRAGLSHEFLNREDGYPGLVAAYGLDLPNLNGLEHGLAYEAIISDRVDVIDTWTTDGKLLEYDIRVLEDNLGFFPPYDAAPVIRAETLERHPELEALLGVLAFRIDDRRMQALNYRVEEEGGEYGEVAREFLASEGLLDPAVGGRTDGGNVAADGFLGFLWSRQSDTLGYLLEHLSLTAIAVSLAILLSVPLGILLTRSEPVAAPVIGAIGVIQTIPSLALLAFMIPLPFLGLGARSAITALFLYALLPIVRNTYTGIREVDAELLDAGRGMGLSPGQILFRVELPLAMRTIMAGVRTSTVISIGVATLAAFIGAGGLGDPIVTGLQLNDTYLILSGALPAALLAIVVDFLLGRVEHRLIPRGLA